MGVRLVRLFWIGAAALLGAAALVAIAAVLRGDFTDTDGKILGILGTALLAGGVALAGLALVERRDLALLGWLAVFSGIVVFAVLAVEIVRGFDEEKLTACGYLALASLLLIVTARLLGAGRAGWIFWAAFGLLTTATIVSMALIVEEPSGDGWAKPLATLWIVAGLAWFLVPVLARLSGREPAAPPRERVVARGPGRHEVELADGELLVVRRG